jgi:hypothetical protein
MRPHEYSLLVHVYFVGEHRRMYSTKIKEESKN